MISTKRKSPETTTTENADSNKTPKIEDNIEDTNEELSRTTRMERVFSNLRLRRVIKENHGGSIKQLAFLFNDEYFTAPDADDLYKTFDQRGSNQRNSNDTCNILISVGGSELSAYDNQHCGSHLDITSNFDITPADVQDKAELRTRHQLETFSWSHKQGDAVLATAGAKGDIHILSLVHSRELRKIEAHDKLIYDLKTHPQNNDILLSTSKDKTVRLWDMTDGKCLAIYKTDATVSSFSPSGDRFITGNSRGEIRLWNTVNMTEAKKTVPTTVDDKSSRLLKKMHGNCYIDCIQFVNDNEVLSKSTNGRLEYWDVETEKTIHTFKIRSGENHSRFDVSLDGQFACAGSSTGAIFVYNLKTGKTVAELGHKKSAKPIRCCVFSRDCRQILAGADDAFLLRYDYIDDDTLQKWTAWSKSI